jgi:hypothetical protein
LGKESLTTIPDQAMLRRQHYLHLMAAVDAAEASVASAELALDMARERLDAARRYGAEALLADLSNETSQ